MALLLKYIRFLSLDIALGAVVLSIVIAKFIGIEMPLSISLCLGIAIWIIYTLDHLIDAFKSDKVPTIQRHLFHRQHSRLLIVALVVTVFGGLYIVLSLPAITFVYGIILTMLVLVYFGIIYFFKWFYLKEIFVAAVYALGVFVGPVSLNNGQIVPVITMLFLQTFFLALINLILFSYFEYHQDKKDQNPSIVIRIGQEKTRQLLKMLFSVLLIIQLYSIVDFGADIKILSFNILFIAMTMVLWTLQAWPVYFGANERYRLIGDGIFFIPTLWLLL
ncbi:hypothetical protein [Reichenbachiella sp. MALMAid0571]|uniref:hypothetical protein n=1 Tax=Reichenbachiella sp. MALMAid0571 TaxID=3143939 RepID=UPI0032DFE1B8